MSNRTWLVNYIVLAVIWGLSFALIKQGLTALTPLQVTTARLGLGAVVVVGLLLATRTFPRATVTEWRHLVVVGVVGLAIPFALIAFAETRVTSILAGLLNAATPLFTAIFITALVPQERPHRLQIVGLLTGFLGIAVLVGVWDLGGTGVDPVGVLAMIAATICYGFGTSFGRVSLSSSSLSGIQLTGIQLLSGTAALLLLLLLDPGTDPGDLTPVAGVSVLALGVLGTGLAMVLFWHVLRQAGATVAATVTYVIPVVSTSVGVLVLRETFTWNQLVGGVIVIGGVVLTQLPQLTGRGVAAPVVEPPD